MFPDNDKLKDEPLSGRKLLAQYAEDRIVFSLEPRQGDPKPLHYGLVSPSLLYRISVSDVEETMSFSSSVSRASWGSDIGLILHRLQPIRS